MPQLIDSQTTQNSLHRKGSAGNFYAKDEGRSADKKNTWHFSGEVCMIQHARVEEKSQLLDQEEDSTGTSMRSRMQGLKVEKHPGMSCACHVHVVLRMIVRPIRM